MKTNNDSIMRLIDMQRRDDGQIAEGVYVVFAYVSDSKELKTVYSRGDYGRKYANGGHWSAHCRNLLTTRLIGTPSKGNTTNGLIVLPGETIIPAPQGIEADITQTEIDCSGSWPVWFTTASDALHDMLTADGIAASSLPAMTKTHLQPERYRMSKDRLNEVITALLL